MFSFNLQRFSDSINNGLLIFTPVLTHGDLVWQKKVEGTWDNSRTIIDTENLNSYNAGRYCVMNPENRSSEKLWLKVASCQLTDPNQESTINFLVEDTSGAHTLGILNIYVKTDQNIIVKQDICNIQWLTNSGFDLNNFILVLPETDSPSVELWTKINDTQGFRSFLILSERSTGTDKIQWTLYSDDVQQPSGDIMVEGKRKKSVNITLQNPADNGTVVVGRGGTGANNARNARINLGLGSVAVQDTPLPISVGGTGATNLASIEVGTATRAINDKNGNDIVETYLREDNAKETYLTKNDAVGTYLKKTDKAVSAAIADVALQVHTSVTGTDSAKLLLGNMANNDSFDIMIGATKADAGYVSFNTHDNGNEPFYFKQYHSDTVTAEATILDVNHNTQFPGIVTASSFTSSITSDSWLKSMQTDGAVVNVQSSTYGTVWNAPTKEYKVSCSTWPAQDNKVWWTSVSNVDINSNKNNVKQQMSWDADTGILTSTKFEGSFVGDVVGNATTATKAFKDGNNNEITSYYVNLSKVQTISGAKTFTGAIKVYSGTDTAPNVSNQGLFICSQTNASEGGQINLCASDIGSQYNGIAIDTYAGSLRVFGIPAADESQSNSAGTILTVNPYTKTITGNYTFVGNVTGSSGSCTGNAVTATKADTATKAICDKNGADITTTYETKANAVTTLSVNGKVITYTKGNGATATIGTQDTTYQQFSTVSGSLGLVPNSDGSKTKYLRADGIWAVPPDTDTHKITYLYAGSASGNKNEQTTNSNTYLIVYHDSTVRSRVKLAGTGNTSVTSDSNGNITIHSLVYSDATTAKSGLMSAADKIAINNLNKNYLGINDKAVAAKTADSAVAANSAMYDSNNNRISTTYLTVQDAKDTYLQIDKKAATASLADKATQVSISSDKESGHVNLAVGRMQNDWGSIRFGATAKDKGYLEFATGDGGTESIVARQYDSLSDQGLAAEAVILDQNHNTRFPGIVTAEGFNGLLNVNNLDGVLPVSKGGTGYNNFRTAFTKHMTFGIACNGTSNPTNPWYKVATCTAKVGTLTNRNIVFLVQRGIPASTGRYGILKACFRADASGQVSSDNCALTWIIQGATGAFDEWALTITTGSSTVAPVATLWTKLDTAQEYFVLTVLSDSDARANEFNNWVYSNVSKANGDAATLPTGIQIFSTTTKLLFNNIVELAEATLNGHDIGGDTNWYFEVSTAAGTAAKVTDTVSNYSNFFQLKKGVIIMIYLKNANTVANPTLNINNTGAIAMKTAKVANFTASNMPAGMYTFMYNGSYYCCIGSPNDF